MQLSADQHELIAAIRHAAQLRGVSSCCCSDGLLLDIHRVWQRKEDNPAKQLNGIVGSIAAHGAALRLMASEADDVTLGG